MVHDKSTEQNSITLTAVGDILLHGRVYGGLRKKKDFLFDEQLAGVKHLIGKTDLTMANLETVIAGTKFGLSGFPRFNGPAEISHTLKDMGVDLVTLANNHVLDQGEEGLIKSINNIEKADLIYDGAYKSLEDSEKLRVFKINGLKICFISYTSGTNGIKLPEEKSYMVNTLRNTSTLRLSSILRKIQKKEIADVIVLSLHFGGEYHLLPSNKQKQIVRSLSDAGANVIIGHHPHVLQPPEWIENSRGTKTFVAYSLGNFFSGQNGLHRQIGAVLSLKITKPDPRYRGIIIENPKYNLTFTKREKRLRYDVYEFKEWMKGNDYIETADGKFPTKEVYENVKSRMRYYTDDLEIE